MSNHCNAEDTLALSCLMRIKENSFICCPGGAGEGKLNVYVTQESPRRSLDTLNYFTSLSSNTFSSLAPKNTHQRKYAIVNP